MADQKETEHSSFAVAIEPDFNENNEWTGSVIAHVEEIIKDDLDADQVLQLRSVCGMLVACMQLLETDEDFRYYVQETFIEHHKDMIESFVEELEDKPNFTKSDDGKVITLDFSTKTYGSA